MPKHRVPRLHMGAKMKVISLSCVSVLALTMSFASAQEARRGTVVGVDEAAGSITIQQPQAGGGGDEAAGAITIQQPQAGRVGANSPGGPPDRYAVQDGLLFNALRVGDKVAFSSQEISGVNTITKLQKE